MTFALPDLRPGRAAKAAPRAPLCRQRAFPARPGRPRARRAMRVMRVCARVHAHAQARGVQGACRHESCMRRPARACAGACAPAQARAGGRAGARDVCDARERAATPTPALAPVVKIVLVPPKNFIPSRPQMW